MFRIINNASSDSVTKSTLLVHMVQNTQFGDYFCKATNIYGSDEVLLNIHSKYWFYYYNNNNEHNFFRMYEIKRYLK